MEAAAPPGDVDIMAMDPFDPKTLNFERVPLPPTDLGFAKYRPGFAYALVFFFSRALRRKYPLFWNALHKGRTAVYKSPITSNQLIHPPVLGDIGYSHAIAIIFFYDQRLREAFPKFWDRIDKGWKYLSPANHRGSAKLSTCLWKNCVQ